MTERERGDRGIDEQIQFLGLRLCPSPCCCFDGVSSCRLSFLLVLFLLAPLLVCSVLFCASFATVGHLLPQGLFHSSSSFCVPWPFRVERSLWIRARQVEASNHQSLLQGKTALQTDCMKETQSDRQRKREKVQPSQSDETNANGSRQLSIASPRKDRPPNRSYEEAQQTDRGRARRSNHRAVKRRWGRNERPNGKAGYLWKRRKRIAEDRDAHSCQHVDERISESCIPRKWSEEDMIPCSASCPQTEREPWKTKRIFSSAFVHAVLSFDRTDAVSIFCKLSWTSLGRDCVGTVSEWARLKRCGWRSECLVDTRSLFELSFSVSSSAVESRPIHLFIRSFFSYLVLIILLAFFTVLVGLESVCDRLSWSWWSFILPAHLPSLVLDLFFYLFLFCLHSPHILQTIVFMVVCRRHSSLFCVQHSWCDIWNGGWHQDWHDTWPHWGIKTRLSSSPSLTCALRPPFRRTLIFAAIESYFVCFLPAANHDYCTVLNQTCLSSSPSLTCALRLPFLVTFISASIVYFVVRLVVHYQSRFSSSYFVCFL